MKITKMDNQGRGITYYNNKICFVNNALPKEEVDISLILDKKRYCIAKVEKYNKKSIDRIKEKCKYYDFCGGCQLQHINYSKEINYKLNYLNEIFKPLNINIDNIIESKEYNYRNKITLKVKDNKIGFYNINSNNIININKCLIADNLINSKIKYLNKLNTKNINEIILKTFDNKIMLVINGKNNIDTSKINKFFDTVYINDKLVYGNSLIATIDKVKYFISPNAFFQVNLDIASKMFNYIKEICIKVKAKNVMDLYCGCGSISLFIANSVNYVYGVELNESSIKDANSNKALNKITNVTFKCDTTDNINNLNKFDTIIIDPPRSGISKKVTNKLLKSKIQNIIYVSCDPTTLKRDLNLLQDNYNIDKISAFDMFPNTYHIECVCILKIKAGSIIKGKKI